MAAKASPACSIIIGMMLALPGVWIAWGGVGRWTGGAQLLWCCTKHRAAPPARLQGARGPSG